MKENKSPIFQNIIYVLIALCSIAITGLMVYQVAFDNKQITSLKAELDSCMSKIEWQENALTDATDQLDQYEAQLGKYEVQLKEYEKQISDIVSSEEGTHLVSSTKEYAAWITAQSAIEPYDLFYDLQYAYEQLTELDAEYWIGTEKYKGALNLLVPKKDQENLETYLATLKEYFGVSDASIVRSRFIDALVSTKLLIDEGTQYSWYRDTLTTKNVMVKLNLTEDVANALLGLLRAMDWDV